MSALGMVWFARPCPRNVWLDSQHCSAASLIKMFVDTERCNDWLTSVHMVLYKGFFRSDTRLIKVDIGFFFFFIVPVQSLFRKTNKGSQIYGLCVRLLMTLKKYTFHFTSALPGG